MVRDEKEKWYEMNDEMVSKRDADAVRANCETEGCERLSVGVR